MSFKEFDLSDYIGALENFKNSNTDDIIRHFGSVENFDLLIQKVKSDESEVAKLAIQQYGSIEKYTEAMKYNLEHFSEIVDNQLTEDARKIVRQIDSLYAELTSDRSVDCSSARIQNIVREIAEFTQANAATAPLEESYWNMVIQAYTSDYIKAVTDSKYGAGSADYIVKAFRYYLEHNR